MLDALTEVLKQRDDINNLPPGKKDAVEKVMTDDVKNKEPIKETLKKPVEKVSDAAKTEKPEEDSGFSDDAKSKIKDLESKLESNEKQRRDNQSFMQHQLNDARMQLEAKKQADVEAAKPVITDEEINDLYLEDPVKATAAFNQREATKQTASTKAVDMDFQIQLGVAKALHPDFAEVVAVVERAIVADPSIEAELYATGNPVEAAYQKGVSMRSAHEINTNPEAYREKVRKELLQEIEDKNQKEQPKRLGASGSSPYSKDDGHKKPQEQNGFEALFQKK